MFVSYMKITKTFVQQQKLHKKSETEKMILDRFIVIIDYRNMRVLDLKIEFNI